MRIIDADALKRAFCNHCDGEQPCTEPCVDIGLIETAPTIDAVPVVLCGECVHYHDEDDPPYCDELCTIHVEKTDGCLRGIKRSAEVGYRAEDGERKEKTMLIVDMPMPKGCYFCPMSATYPTDWYCMAHDDSKSIDGCAPMNERPSWCPIKGELVLCGECIMGLEENGEKYCGGVYHKLDWFCADGERKDGEG